MERSAEARRARHPHRRVAMVMILNLGIGLLSPPVGPTIVVGCAIGGVSMEAVSRSILVFYVPMLVVLVLVTYLPALSLWLPSLVLR